MLSPDVAWLPKIATLSAEVVIIASSSSSSSSTSILVGGVRRCTCSERVQINSKVNDLTDKHIYTISMKDKVVMRHTAIAHQRGTRLPEAHWTLRRLRGKWHAGSKQTCSTKKKKSFNWFQYWSIFMEELKSLDRNILWTLTRAWKRRKLHLWQWRSLGVHQEIVKERHFLFDFFNFVPMFVQDVLPNKLWALKINLKRSEHLNYNQTRLPKKNKYIKLLYSLNKHSPWISCHLVGRAIYPFPAPECWLTQTSPPPPRGPCGPSSLPRPRTGFLSN